MYIASPEGFVTARDRAYLIGFKLIFCYLILYIFPFPLQYVPFLNYLLSPLQGGLMQLTDWVGPILFGDSYYGSNPNSPSGDTSYQYAGVATRLLLASLAALLWIVIDRKGSGYPRLSLILITCVRFYLAMTLISYGLVKIFPLQFSTPPSPEALARTYGASSPMGLLWTFMGASRLYSVFTGAGELLAGILLLFRSTRLIGAVLSIFIFIHVFVLNLSYDVPVKLFSFHLLLMSILLATPLMKKTINLFVTGEPPLAETVLPRWNPRRMRWLLMAAKSILIVFILILPAYVTFQRYRELRAEEAQPSQPTIYGAYSVSGFTRNHERLPDTSPGCWREIKLSSAGMEIVHGDGISVLWISAVRSNKLRMASRDLTSWGEFELVMNGDKLSLAGKLNDDSLRIEARQTGPYHAPLLNREFHWISEEPYNR